MKRRWLPPDAAPSPLEPSIVVAWVGRRYPRLTRSRSQHHHDRAHFDAVVEIDHVLVGHPDAARRNRMSDPFRLVGSMDAVQRVPAAGEEIDAARAHGIGWSAFDIVRERAEPPLLALGRRPPRPFFLAANLRDTGPRLRLFAHDHAIADRLVVRQHVIEIARVTIDDDRTRRFFP